MKRITFNLSEQSINKAIQELEQYKQDIIYKTRKLAERLAEEGVYSARVNIAEYDAIYSGKLLESIHHELGGVIQDGAKWIVYTGNPYAKFIEFGFGIKAESTGYKGDLPSGWKYDLNGHGWKGWYFPTDRKDLCVYTNDEGQMFGWSCGQGSKPFMYMTARDLKRKVLKVAKEVFHD